MWIEANYIKDQGAKALGNALNFNKTLQELNLGFCFDIKNRGKWF